MSSLPFSTVIVTRARMLTAMLGAAMLASPLAFAQSATTAPTHQTRTAREAETVDQRIATLHAQLKITPAQEPNWQTVAQTMRDNAAMLQKLSAEAEKSSQQGMTAIEDLQTYTRFAEAHVAELKKLTSSFQTLYDTMSDQQKKLADQVFQRSRG